MGARGYLGSLIVKAGLPETRESFGPDVHPSHYTIAVSTTDTRVHLFPAEIKALMQIAAVLRVRVLAQESRVALEV